MRILPALLALLLVAGARAEVLDLTGPWHFRPDPSDRGLRDGWSSEGPPDGWTPVPVPSNWNTLRPEWARYEGVAWYRREFTLDRTYPIASLDFLGANDRARVWLNGAEVGGHEGAYTGFSLDVASALRLGVNRLVVRLDNSRRWDGVPPGWYGFENYGGIYREVSLELKEAGWRYMGVRVLPSRDGRFSLEVSPRLPAHPTRPVGTLRVLVDGREMLPPTPALSLVSFPPIPLENLSLWSPSAPNLHRLEVRVEDVNGTGVLDSFNLSFGLRSLEVRGPQLLLNGEPLRLRGVAMHEEHPGIGRVFNESLVRRDFGMMKQAGVNFVRLSHYPHHPRVLDIADEVGLLVMEEIPAYWMSAAQMGDPGVRGKAEAQVREMVARDIHHPSVVLWGVGNEVSSHTPAGEEFLCHLARVARQVDPARPVTFASNRPGDDRAWGCMDVVSLNEYYGWYHGSLDTLRRTLGHVRRVQPEKPILITEFGADAVPGRRGAGKWTEEFQARFIADHWRVINSTPGVLGGVVWVWADFEDPVRPLNPVPYWNMKGLVSAGREPKLAYGVVSDLYHGREPSIPAVPPEGLEPIRVGVALAVLGVVGLGWLYRREPPRWMWALVGALGGLGLPMGMWMVMERNPLALLGPRPLLDAMVLLVASPVSLLVGSGLFLLWAGVHGLLVRGLGGQRREGLSVAATAGLAALPLVASVSAAVPLLAVAAAIGGAVGFLGLAIRESRHRCGLSWGRAVVAGLVPGMVVAGVVAGLILLYLFSYVNPDWFTGGLGTVK